MWVEDEEGNTDYCKTVIIVQDIQNICGGPDGGKIYGQAISIKNRIDTIPATNVKYFLFRNVINLYKELTSSEGKYLFGNLIKDTYTLGA